MKKTVNLTLLILTSLILKLEDLAEARPTGEGGLVSSPAGKAEHTGGPTFDRLSWLSSLIEQLKTKERPDCVGPRGCTMTIPEDSPCRQPARNRPEPIIDGVLPGGSQDTWTVAYRLMCSTCYLGGEGQVSLVRVGKKGGVRILDTLTLKKSAEQEIPDPIEMSYDDVDDDDRYEIVITYRNTREKKYKCTGMEDASTYLLVARAEPSRIVEVLHEQLAAFPAGKGRPYTSEYRFEDENEDAYPDLLLTRTDSPSAPCSGKNQKCATSRTTRTVRRYVEDKDDWSAQAYSGHALTDKPGIDCDVPLPETPFAVVAETFAGKHLTKEMEEKARKLRKAGFSRACLYNGADFKGLSPERFYLIESAHETRDAADNAARALRKAKFRPFVKELF